MRLFLAGVALVLCPPAGAQERGRDPDAFVPTDFRAFGVWELISLALTDRLEAEEIDWDLADLRAGLSALAAKAQRGRR
jgi:hypothetical protein